MRDVAERSAVQRVWRLHGRIVNKLQQIYYVCIAEDDVHIEVK